MGMGASRREEVLTDGETKGRGAHRQRKRGSCVSSRSPPWINGCASVEVAALDLHRR